ncbi:PEGA domain-containing protein, partial [Elusimicrobiota bacterium]
DEPGIEGEDDSDIVPDTPKDSVSKEEHEPEPEIELTPEKAVSMERSEPSSLPELSGEKTIFDFVLDTAKKHIKIFISTIISLILASIIYTGIDTYMQLTKWGIKIHNMIWPPALQIDSMPSSAHIMLLNQNNVDIIKKGEYKSTTPSYIKEIQPGVYTLKLNKEGYKEIIRKVSVYGEFEDDRAISIARAKKIGNSYIVPFEITLEVYSVPEGADLYMDDVRIGKTPYKVLIEIGKNNFRLVKKGFEVLGNDQLNTSAAEGSCILNTSLPAERQSQVDKRYWTVNARSIPGKGQKYTLNANMWKNFNIGSDPEGAIVFLNKNTESIGKTPILKLPLTAGTTHLLVISKSGYKSWTKKLKVESDTVQDIFTKLDKFIFLSSYHKGVSKKDFGAKVTIAGTGIAKTTPFEVALPVKKYKLTFSKEPRYRAVTIKRNIATADPKINIGLILKNPHITIKAVDSKTNKAIKAAKIWVSGTYWKRTNQNGVAAGYIQQPTGETRIEIRISDYPDYYTSMYIEKATRKRLDVMLGKNNDCVIFVDASKGYKDSSIYLNDDLKGTDSVWLYNIPHARHLIKLSGRRINGTVKQKLIVNKKDQIFLYRLQRKNSKDVLAYWDPLKDKEIEGKELKEFSAEVNLALKKMPNHPGLMNLSDGINNKLYTFTENSEETMLKANELFLEGKYKEAVDIYQQIVDVDKGNAEAKLKLLEAKQYMKQESDIRIDQQKAQKILDSDKNIAGYYKRGMSAMDNKEYDKALAEFEKGLDISKQKNSLGYSWNGKFRESIYETKIQLSEQSYLQSEELVFQEKFSEANQKLKEALSFNPFNNKARNKMNELRKKTTHQNTEKADQLYAKGINTGDIKAIEEAVKIYREILIVDKDNYSIKQKVDDSKYKIEKIKESIKEQGQLQAEKKVESKVDRFYQKGLKEFDNKRFVSALSQFRKGYEIVKNWKNKSWKEKIGRKIEQTKIRLAEQYYENGYTYYQKNKLEEAIKEFKKALSYNPANTQARAKINEIKSKIKNISLKKAEKMYSLGLDEYAAGNDREAITLWEKVLEIDPNHKETLKALERIKEKLRSK